MNALQDIDHRILDFSRQPGHETLARRTRSYCTPFRGTLFGVDTQEEVLEHLSGKRADVLVLGSNPQTSGELDPRTQHRYRALEDHIETGAYGEVYWDRHGRPGPGWKVDASRTAPPGELLLMRAGA